MQEGLTLWSVQEELSNVADLINTAQQLGKVILWYSVRFHYKVRVYSELH